MFLDSQFENKKVRQVQVIGRHYHQNLLGLLSFFEGTLCQICKIQLQRVDTLKPIMKCLFDLKNDGLLQEQAFVSLIVQIIDRSVNLQTRIKDYDAFINQIITLIINTTTQLACDSKYLLCKWQEQGLKAEQLRYQQFQLQRMLSKERQQDRIRRSKIEDVKPVCEICEDEIQMQDIGTLSCSHIYHRNCLHECFKVLIQAGDPNILCPNQHCRYQLPQSDISQYIEGPLLDKLNQFSFDKYVQKNTDNTSWCPTAGCQAVFQFDQLLDNYKCASCRKHYCLRCKCQFHSGMSCKEYRINNSFDQNDKRFETLMVGSKFKQCPRCKFWVEKVSGCVSILCRCGKEFCYQCGGIECPHGSCNNSGAKIK